MDGLAGFYVGNLLTNGGGTAVGVGGDADEPTDTGLHDLLGHVDTFGGGGDEFNLELGGKGGGGGWRLAVGGWDGAQSGRVGILWGLGVEEVC